MRSFRIAACLILFAAALTLPAEAGKIYWTETYCTEVCVARIARANQDGSDVSAVTDYRDVGINGIGLDPLRGDVYWSQFGPTRGIFRGNDEGCEPLAFSAYPRKLRVDPVGEKLYWQSSPDRIERDALDGGAREHIYRSTDTWEITSFALDLVNAKVYVAESDYHNSGERVIEINTDGSGFSPVFSPVPEIHDITVDPTAGKLYWIADFPRQIRRVGVDGSNDELLLELDSSGWTIAVDSLDAKIYWAQGPGEIRRAELDGSAVELLVSGVRAKYLTLDPLDEFEVDWIDCSPANVPALGKRGAAALVLLLLAASGWWLSRRRARPI